MDSYLSKKISSILNDCYEKNKPYVTSFLSMSEQEIVKMEIKKYPTLYLKFDGGIKNAEYQKAILNKYSS